MSKPKPLEWHKCPSCKHGWYTPKEEWNAFFAGLCVFFKSWGYPTIVIATIVGYSFIWCDSDTRDFIARIGLTWVVVGWVPSAIIGRIAFWKKFKEEKANEMAEALAGDNDRETMPGADHFFTSSRNKGRHSI